MEPNRPDFVTTLPEFTKLATAYRSQLKASARDYDAALDLMLEADPSTVNTSQCAKVLGVSRKTLYRHLDERVAAEQAERAKSQV